MNQQKSAGHDFVLDHITAISLLIIGVGLSTFIVIANTVMAGGMHAFDEGMLMSMRVPGDLADPIGPSWLEVMFRDFTALGGVGVLILITFGTMGYLLLRGKKHAALFIILAVSGGLLLSTALKSGFDRTRPDLVAHGTAVSSASFPSGHSMLSAVVYLTCGPLLAAVHKRRRVRAYLILCAVLLTFLVGMSRIYLGVHWPTDVLAGWAAGSAWAAACWLVARWLQERGRLEDASDPANS